MGKHIVITNPNVDSIVADMLSSRTGKDFSFVKDNSDESLPNPKAVAEMWLEMFYEHDDLVKLITYLTVDTDTNEYEIIKLSDVAYKQLPDDDPIVTALKGEFHISSGGAAAAISQLRHDKHYLESKYGSNSSNSDNGSDRASTSSTGSSTQRSDHSGSSEPSVTITGDSSLDLYWKKVESIIRHASSAQSEDELANLKFFFTEGFNAGSRSK